jgi:hypothetical protein
MTFVLVQVDLIEAGRTADPADDCLGRELHAPRLAVPDPISWRCARYRRTSLRRTRTARFAT